MTEKTENILAKILGEKAISIVNIEPSKIIENPFQARKVFDSDKLAALAQSIAAVGVLEPILVRPVESEGAVLYGLLAGQRRVIASKMAGKKTIPAIIIQVNSDKDLKLIGLVENIQRVDLSLMDKMMSIADLRAEFDTKADMASSIGMSTRSIERYEKIYRDMFSLPDILNIFSNDPENADYANMKALSELAPSIRKIKKSDKREYSRILAKFEKTGIRATLSWLKHKFSDSKSTPTDNVASSEPCRLIETDKKIMLNLVLEKSKTISSENINEFKKAMHLFIRHAQKIKKFQTKYHASEVNNTLN